MVSKGLIRPYISTSPITRHFFQKASPEVAAANAFASASGLVLQAEGVGGSGGS